LHFLVHPSMKCFVPPSCLCVITIPFLSPFPSQLLLLRPPSRSPLLRSVSETPGQARRNIVFFSVSFNEVLSGLCASFAPLRLNDTHFEYYHSTATASPAPEPPACRQAGSLPFQSAKETPGQARRNIAFFSASFNEVLRGLCASFVSLCYNDTLVESLLISVTASPAPEPEPPFSISEGDSGSSPERHCIFKCILQ